MQYVPQIRIFLASPGDVNEERAITLQVFDMLEHDPLFRRGGTGGVSIHAVAWDAPGGDTPQRATKTPQTAIREGLPLPSECDIVIALFWSRMGTPLPYPEYQKANGAPYLSGSEWEFWDALTAERAHGKPITLIYRRIEKPAINLDDDAALDQYIKVREFFAQFRDPVSGALLGGVNEYRTPEDLRLKLLTHLRTLIDQILTVLQTEQTQPGQQILASASSSRVFVEAAPAWEGSPFPGLRAFTEHDAPIFFGRGRETSELVRRVEASRFVGVVAASGSGKSSLVAAGLIPRLKANAIASGETGSYWWRYVSFRPGGGSGDGPFAALFDALCAAFPEHVVPPSMLRREWQTFVTGSQASGSDANDQHIERIIDFCQTLLVEAKAPAWVEILFVVDQFEELFTLVNAADRAAFVALLEAIYSSRRLRCIVTMRSDFYANCAEWPALATLLNAGNYTLAAPTAGALVDMIKRPAERAGLLWDDGLPEYIQAETGSESGALALMAYALDELYKASIARQDKRLTLDDYTAIGGVAGAIGKRAESIFTQLKLPEKAKLLQHVFRELTIVDERGTATRQRAIIEKFDADEQTLIRALAEARLLVIDGAAVEVAHEAVFRSWDRLSQWINGAQEDLILLRQVRVAADEWDRKGQPDFMRWPAERLVLVEAVLARQQPMLNTVEQDFVMPEQARLLQELGPVSPVEAGYVPEISHERRRDIGDRLAVVGDVRPGVGLSPEGIPDILWLPVNVSPEPVMIALDGHDNRTSRDPRARQEIRIAPFFIAQYPLTYPQFQAFVDASDGFNADRWWVDMSDSYKKQAVVNQRTKTANSPRDNISWYQAVAFGRWLNDRLRGRILAHAGSGATLIIGENAQVRLPFEWEWQWAAQSGAWRLKYPWGSVWREGFANTSEAGLSRTTAVGMYPHAASTCGALDMAGNVFEWCQNDKQNAQITTGFANGKSKTVRGGSFLTAQGHAVTTYRDYGNAPYIMYDDVGMRLVVAMLTG